MKYREISVVYLEDNLFEEEFGKRQKNEKKNKTGKLCSW